MTDELRFVHFTDTHVVGPGVRLREVETCRTLERVVDAVNALNPRPAFVIVGGDLVSPDISSDSIEGHRDASDAEYEASYAVLRSILERLEVPFHMLMGNHDRRRPFRRVMLSQEAPDDENHCFVVDADGYRVCALDSLDPGKKPGVLGAGQLDWLCDRLREAAGRDIVIAVHHHAVPIGLERLDVQMLMDAEALWKVIVEAGNVRGVLCGHVHLQHEEVRHGIPVVTTPSTCFQSSKLFKEKQYLTGPPTFRLVTCGGGAMTSELRQL
jgi:3',5'-cyclic AMP phosphodiesterase CpdA